MLRTVLNPTDAGVVSNPMGNLCAIARMDNRFPVFLKVDVLASVPVRAASAFEAIG